MVAQPASQPRAARAPTAAAYIRVSKDSQEDNTSLESQEAACRTFAREQGYTVAAVYRDVHLDHGVELVPRTTVAAFEGEGAVERVRTEDGRTIDCDAVVVGVGVTPRTELAERAGIEVVDGIAVDEHLETSSPGIFAAGDAANARHPSTVAASASSTGRTP